MMPAMTTPPTTFAAPWGTAVRATSWLASAFLLGIALLEALVLPRDLLGGWPWAVGVGVPLLILAVSALFVVRGYELAPGELRVRRLLWDTVVPLDALVRAWAAPDAMAGSLRLFGNGGLFSLTGLFRNRSLGNFRAFAMDPRRAVVLDMGSRKVVVTPGSPEELLRQLRLVSPAAAVLGAPPPGRESAIVG
jgi:hypothetical protein